MFVFQLVKLFTCDELVEESSDSSQGFTKLVTFTQWWKRQLSKLLNVSGNHPHMHSYIKLSYKQIKLQCLAKMVGNQSNERTCCSTSGATVHWTLFIHALLYLYQLGKAPAPK